MPARTRSTAGPAWLRWRTGRARPRKLLLNENEVDEFEAVVEATIRTHTRDFEEDRVAPGPDGLRRLVSTYRAHLGQGSFRSPSCNAPWASLFIEADGGVRPASSTRRGQPAGTPLADLLSHAMPDFRDGLDVATDPTCQRCVCSLRVGLRTKLW